MDLSAAFSRNCSSELYQITTPLISHMRISNKYTWTRPRAHAPTVLIESSAGVHRAFLYFTSWISLLLIHLDYKGIDQMKHSHFYHHHTPTANAHGKVQTTVKETVVWITNGVVHAHTDVHGAVLTFPQNARFDHCFPLWCIWIPVQEVYNHP
jgi:hypothetical protein